jgi:hypothetical protein
MKIVLLSVIVALTVICKVAFAGAASPAKVKRKPAQVESTSPAAQVFVKFLGCREALATAKDASWLSCLDAIAVSADFRRRGFAQFLMSPVQVSKVRDCTENEKKTYSGFPGVTPNAICFDSANGSSSRGAAFFTDVTGTTRLFSLYQFP